MELIYSANKFGRQRREWGREETPICSLSPQNLVAFCTSAELVEATGSRASGTARGGDEDTSDGETTCSSSVCAVVYYVYVCDIDKPWEVSLVTSTPDKVVVIQWHLNGTMLLVATATGLCQIWRMKDHLLNEWSCCQESNIKGEEIIAASWLHLGFKMTFNADKRDSTVYSDKILRSQYRPSLSLFGGKSSDGWVAVTATGMVCVRQLGEQEGPVKTENLGTSRLHFTVADIAFESTGSIVIVASDCMVTSAVLCFRVSLKMDHLSFTVQTQAVASMYPKCHMDPMLRDCSTGRITHIQFMSRESPNVLIVAAGGPSASHVELWHLTNDIIGVHRVYQSSASPDSSYYTTKWVHKSSITHTSLPISIATPRFPVVFTAQDVSAMLFQYIAVAYRDGSLKLVNRHSFQPMATANLDTGLTELDGVEKRRRVVPHLTHMMQTFTGCALLGLDQYSCVYVMKVVNTRDTVTHVPPVYLVGMLEFLLMNGYDWWDVMVALRPGMIENVIQRFSDSFSKQPSVLQDVCYTRFMSIKASLYRCSSVTQQRSADCHAKMILHSISMLFKSMFRPKAVSAQEMSPAEKLSANCSKSAEVDLDKILKAWNLLEFVVDLPTLQSLQQLIQWVADLTLYLLTCLPMSQGYGAFPGILLLHDAGVLSTLRELLVIIRIWGMTNPQCLPHFTTLAPNHDCLAQLFRLVTRVWIMCKDGGGGLDFDDALVDDCYVLPSQVSIPPIDDGLFGNTSNNTSVCLQAQPIQYTFGDVPPHSPAPPWSSASQAAHGSFLPEGQTVSRQRKDIVRQMYLGVVPSEATRECSRCSCPSLLKVVTKSAAVKAWELRFEKFCPCGGHWKLKK